MKTKPIYANISSFWRGDGGNSDFRAGFESNAKQYEWSSVDVVFLSAVSVFFAEIHCQQASLKKRMEDMEQEECFLCDF